MSEYNRLHRFDGDPVAESYGIPARLRATEGPRPDVKWCHATMRSYATIDGIEVSVYGGVQPSDRPGEHTIMVSATSTVGEDGQQRTVTVQQHATGPIDDLGDAAGAALAACRAALTGPTT